MTGKNNLRNLHQCHQKNIHRVHILLIGLHMEMTVFKEVEIKIKMRIVNSRNLISKINIIIYIKNIINENKIFYIYN